MITHLNLGTKVATYVGLILAAGVQFVYITEKQRLEDRIHDKVYRDLLALEASHTQAMIHRGHKKDNNPVIDVLNSTIEYLSDTQENMEIWLFMGSKVLDFQTRMGSAEVEPPLDDVDREAIESRLGVLSVMPGIG